jgi:hypothetical protein
MNSAFLGFDLVGRNAILGSERGAQGFIQPELDDGKEAGLSSE